MSRLAVMLAVHWMPTVLKNSFAFLIFRHTSGRPRLASCLATSWASMDMMTLVRPSLASAFMLSSFHRPPLVQIIGWMPCSAE